MAVDKYRWATIWAVLSLDLADPYIRDMGLKLEDRESFRAKIRRLILSYRKSHEGSSVGQISFAEFMFDRLDNEYDSNFGAHLRTWGEEVFQYSGTDGINVFLWASLISKRDLGESRSSIPAIVDTVRNILATSQEPQLAGIVPTSEWDLEIYERQGYDSLMNPVEMISATIRYVRFVRAWAQALRDYSGRFAVADLYEWGVRRARRMGMPVERLAEPGRWRSLPTIDA